MTGDKYQGFRFLHGSGNQPEPTGQVLMMVLMLIIQACAGHPGWCWLRS